MRGKRDATNLKKSRQSDLICLIMKITLFIGGNFKFQNIFFAKNKNYKKNLFPHLNPPAIQK